MMSRRELIIQEGEEVLKSLKQVLDHVDEQLCVLHEQRDALWKKYTEFEQHYQTALAQLEKDD